MQGLLGLSRMLDRILAICSGLGGWFGLMLVFLVCYDVITRYFGVPKPEGINSTMIQEAEYWLHSALIIFCLAYAYTRNAHVRIDLVREGLSEKSKYWIEAIGLTVALIPYSALGIWLSYPYAKQSFLSGEISKSQTGLSNLWILKAGLVMLFVLLLFAGISQLIKSIAGIRGQLPEDMRKEMMGSAH
ncbi:TRAP transporter small permease subunit [Thalassococcus sp. CAU 1522]|uniref:TRAP transporter small permease protein n=1 Tax=Thalassococcus arenae TaxID=2851652 RepID=A0ABS6NAM3_9RHOB|nr:TRAP transporter small permease subunit [Thalassococcus arenae]MBV2360639.1 TRAP transporter small permease subunit [Thalassococcus arenae]